MDFGSKSAELRDEWASRLGQEEAEKAHKRRIDSIVSIFVIAVVAVALLIGAGVVLIEDPKAGLPDKAMSIMAAIAAAGVGYLSGRASK